MRRSVSRSGSHNMAQCPAEVKHWPAGAATQCVAGSGVAGLDQLEELLQVAIPDVVAAQLFQRAVRIVVGGAIDALRIGEDRAVLLRAQFAGMAGTAARKREGQGTDLALRRVRD